MSGDCATGRGQTAIPPAGGPTIESTEAKIGRSMKNFENMRGGTFVGSVGVASRRVSQVVSVGVGRPVAPAVTVTVAVCVGVSVRVGRGREAAGGGCRGGGRAPEG